MKLFWVLLLGVSFVISMAILGYYFGQKTRQLNMSDNLAGLENLSQSEGSNLPKPTPDPIADWFLYQSEDCGYQIPYPPEIEYRKNETKDEQVKVFFEYTNNGQWQARMGIECLDNSEMLEPQEYFLKHLFLEKEWVTAQKSMEATKFRISGNEGIGFKNEKDVQENNPDDSLLIQIGQKLVLIERQYADPENEKNSDYQGHFFLMILFMKAQRAEAINGAGENCRKIGSENEMSLLDAKFIAVSSECGEQGKLTGEFQCNEKTGAWWLGLDIERSGCAPACVVDTETRKAEINWRCTGLTSE